MPPAQAWHWLAPRADAKLPLAQARHWLVPGEDAKRPMAHGELAPTRQLAPGAHATQSPLVAHAPGMSVHVLHVVAP